MKMKKFKNYRKGPWIRALITMTIAGWLVSCDIINPDEEIPAYIYITGFDLSTGIGQGSASHAITDAWLTVNGEFLGMYTLPATIPILAQGEVNINLDAGIKDNGITSTPDIYPFYEPFSINVDLQPNEIDTIRPTTRYRSNTKFSFIEEFETENQIFRELRIGDLEHRVFLSDDVVFEGGRSGMVPLDADFPAVEIATVDEYSDLTSTGAFVYVEVNYLSQTPVLFGVVAIDGGSNEVFLEAGFLPSTVWNKIYLNLTPLFFMGRSFESYKIVFQSVIPFEGNEPAMDNASLYLDNVKLVHF